MKKKIKTTEQIFKEWKKNFKREPLRVVADENIIVFYRPNMFGGTFSWRFDKSKK